MYFYLIFKINSQLNILINLFFRTRGETPPPLPPHAVPLESNINAEDYKPPVPPHRNIGVTARMTPTNPATSPLIAPPPRKHHHHHHHRSNSKHMAVIEPKKTAFEFEDAEPSGDNEQELFQLGGKERNLNNDDDDIEFVQFPQSSDGISNGLGR